MGKESRSPDLPQPTTPSAAAGENAPRGSKSPELTSAPGPAPRPHKPHHRENDNPYRELFNHLKSGAAIYEVRQSGEEVILKDLNKRAEYIERLNREDLLGRNFRDIFTGREAAALCQVIQRVWLTGASEHLPPSYYEDEHSSGWREHFVYKLPSSEVVVIYDNVTARVLAEKARRESEERLHQLAEHLQDVLWIATPGFEKIIYVSPAYEKIWGRSCDSLYKAPKSFFDAIHPEDLNRVLSSLDEHHLQKDPWTITYRVMRPDGSTRWVEDRCFPASDKQGNIYRLIGLAADITQRKQVEADLHTVKARHEYLLTQSPAVIYSCEPVPPYRPTYISKNVVSLIGYESWELLDNPSLWQENIHPEDVFSVTTAITLLLECGTMSLEYRFRNKDGNCVWIQDELVLVHDEQGNPLELVGFLINISQRKRAEEALRQSEIQYSSLVENSLDGYLIAQFPSGKFLFLNQRLCQLYGCSQRAGLRLSFADLIAPPDQERFQNWVQTHMQRDYQDSTPQVFTLQRQDGTTFLAEVVASRVLFQAKSAVQVVVRDISERERLRQQVQFAQKMQALGTMAAGIAHEIRSPLTVCSSAAQFILDDDLSPEFRGQCLKKMLASITKASTIIENLLKFARSPERVEASQMELGAIINDTLELVANQARLQNISVEKNMPPAPIYFQGFAGLLPQVFMNLFLNAVNAMSAGGTLGVTVETSRHEAVISITDTGRGIATADLPFIFDPFFTASQTDQGTGLGLSICQSIIKQHLGSIEVESTPGQGTSFIVRLPILSQEMAPPEHNSGKDS